MTLRTPSHKWYSHRSKRNQNNKKRSLFSMAKRKGEKEKWRVLPQNKLDKAEEKIQKKKVKSEITKKGKKKNKRRPQKFWVIFPTTQKREKLRTHHFFCCSVKNAFHLSAETPSSSFTLFSCLIRQKVISFYYYFQFPPLKQPSLFFF